MSDVFSAAQESKAWPFVEARSLLKHRLRNGPGQKGYVLFETGYGPSGLPHIGTFAEVVRTTMVRHAFQLLAPEIPTRLFAFSDDMDGLRKVPDNVPNKEMIAGHLGKPLTCIPDPFGSHESFGHHNNDRLRGFLDSFGFDYEFKSSTECYKSGDFDEILLRVLNEYDKVINVILPTLGPERRQTYSPFLPVCVKTGQILQVPIIQRDADAGTIVYEDVDGSKIEVPVTGGHCKLQWKCDWAMRWTAFDVDYEMSGKDLIESFKLSSKICSVLAGNPPNNLTYELFLDDQGQKISKSKGNGLAVEDWLTYAPVESLAQFMYQKPTAAKRLYFDTIPKSVDDYLAHLKAFPGQDFKEQLSNPTWHIHNGEPPEDKNQLSFSILLNLASVCHSDDSAVLWYYISRYAPGSSPSTDPLLDKLVSYAIAYYRDFVLPNKAFRLPTDEEQQALQELKLGLQSLGEGAAPEDVQTLVYSVGKNHDETFLGLKNWFKALYQILLGQNQGPRIGSFMALYGIEESIDLIDRVLAGEDLSQD
ncbi:MAG: lysine--tRNA ligase [Rhodospirillaceae bacterium]